MKRYPECEKLSETSEKRDLLSEFLDWLREAKGVRLSIYHGEKLILWNQSRDTLLAEFFGIDLGKVERERRELLESNEKREQLKESFAKAIMKNHREKEKR